MLRRAQHDIILRISTTIIVILSLSKDQFSIFKAVSRAFSTEGYFVGSRLAHYQLIITAVINSPTIPITITDNALWLVIFSSLAVEQI